jgi:hypothetical protein
MKTVRDALSTAVVVTKLGLGLGLSSIPALLIAGCGSQADVNEN